MSPSEILDIVDEKGKVIGQASRAECHSNPKLIHQVSHCWIFNNKGQILWQLRSLKKLEGPGAWDMSCGGHVPTGEKPDITLQRELKEELGLENVDINFVEKYVRGNEKQTELIYLYYAIVDKTETEFVIQKDEVEKVKWIDVHEAQTLYKEGKVESTEFVISQVSRILQHDLVVP